MMKRAISLLLLLVFILWTVSSDAIEKGGAGATSGQLLTGPFTLSGGTLTISDSASIPPLNFTERSSAPSAPSSGDIYLDDGSNTGSGNPGFRRYTGAAWEDVTAAAGGDGGSSRWTAESTFSRTDDNTISITTADCTNFQPGTPARFSADESTWFYAMVDTCADVGATINVDIFGHPIETDKDDYLNYGIPEVLTHIELIGVGNCSVSDTWFPKYFWTGQDAYLIVVFIYVDTQATGAALQLNIEINGTNGLDTELNLAVSTTQADSGTTIDDTTYGNALIEQEEFIEVDVSQCGSTIPGGNSAWFKIVLATP